MLGQQALGSSGWAVPDSVPTTFCRDLKAANLLMDDNGIVKIGDFGVARVMDTLGVMTAETGTYRWVLLLAPRFVREADCSSVREHVRSALLQRRRAAEHAWAQLAASEQTAASSLCPQKPPSSACQDSLPLQVWGAEDCIDHRDCQGSHCATQLPNTGMPTGP